MSASLYLLQDCIGAYIAARDAVMALRHSLYLQRMVSASSLHCVQADDVKLSEVRFFAEVCAKDTLRGSSCLGFASPEEDACGFLGGGTMGTPYVQQCCRSRLFSFSTVMLSSCLIILRGDGVWYSLASYARI